MILLNNNVNEKNISIEEIIKENKTEVVYVENSDKKKCEKCKELKKYLDKTILLGPTKAIIFKKMNIYTYQIILKYQYQDNIYEILDKLLNYYATKKIVEVSVTFNPVHL